MLKNIEIFKNIDEIYKTVVKTGNVFSKYRSAVENKFIQNFDIGLKQVSRRQWDE